MSNLIARPLVRFLLLGAIAFAVSRSPALLRNRALDVSRGDDEEILLHEAFRLGLDRSDPVVRRRLVANLRFAGADPQASDDALLHEARELGMDRSDVVVRRRLVQAVEQRLDALDRRRSPSDRELSSFLEAHPERFAAPASWRFAHVLVSAARHPRDLDLAAASLRSSLVAEQKGPEAASRRGDPFLLGNRLGPASRGEIAATFGDDFAAAIISLEPGRWSAPIRSAWGLHLVWVEEATPAHVPSLADVRSRVRLAWLTEEAERARRERVASLAIAERSR